MKLVIGTVASLAGVLFVCSMASANPALLPKHEGYPMKNVKVWWSMIFD